MPTCSATLHYELQERVALASGRPCEIVERDDVLARHHQDVLGSLGVDVAKGDEISVFENDVARDLPAGDPTEYAVVHGG